MDRVPTLPVTAFLPNGAKFSFCIHEKVDQFISTRIRERGSWEPFETSIIYSLLRSGDVLVDVGANIGWYTIVAGLRVGDLGRVVAFEPDMDNADVLERNVNLNRLTNVQLFRCALAETPGFASFAKSDTNLGDHRIGSGRGTSPCEEVPVETLDRLVATQALSLDKVRIVKIDAQGAELRVLRGARQTLARLPADCALFVEFSPNLLRIHRRDSPDFFVETLASMSRAIYIIDARFRTIHLTGAAELLRYADECSDAREDVGLDLILAPRDNTELRRFRRIYAPVVKWRMLRRIAVRRAANDASAA